jgi:hypothetical protein
MTFPYVHEIYFDHIHPPPLPFLNPVLIPLYPFHIPGPLFTFMSFPTPQILYERKHVLYVIVSLAYFT